MTDPHGLATEVVVILQKALAPVLERLAAAEARLSVLGDLRDRVVTVETKAAMPMPAAPIVEPAVDLTPVLERLTKAETQLAAVEDLSTKDAIRIEGYTASLQRKLDDLKERVVVVEARQPVPGPQGPPGEPGKDAPVGETKAAHVDADWPAFHAAMSDLRDRLVTLETRAAGPSLTDMALVDMRKAVGDLHAESSMLRERVAVVEVRAQVPGPAGLPGAPGRDGVDGLGFDDLSVVQQDERSFTVKATRGDRAKDIGTLTFPVEIYRGVYIEGKSYERGDRVTWAGSEWHANEGTATKPGDGSKAWTLTVKRGRDGKDGRDAPSLPVVSVGAR